jgi:hypothetical protein
MITRNTASELISGRITHDDDARVSKASKKGGVTGTFGG